MEIYTKLASLFSLMCLFTSVASFAAIPVRQAANEKQNHYLDAGVFVGGLDHGVMSLLNVRHSLKDTLERVVFDVGPKVVTPNVDRPSFFHIAIQEKPRRIVIDLEDVSETKVTPEQISRLLQKSPYITKVSVVIDSLHKNMTLELSLKGPTQMEVFELSSSDKPGRIVMDLIKAQ